MEAWFDGQVVFVTGGGSGIGRAAARLFAARGAKVAVTDIGGDSAAAVADDIRAAGGAAISMALDVTDRGAVEAAIARVADQLGGLAIAFNNAGITHHGDAEWTDESFDRIIDVNLHGVRNCMRSQIPLMVKAGGGVIVNTASTNGLRASQKLSLPAYTASKHAIIGLTRDAALQYARSNIRINALCPGMTDTGMNDKTVKEKSSVRIALEAMQPMGRIARPEEIAEAAVWLGSAKASFVNGHAMIVDGGLLAGV